MMLKRLIIFQILCFLLFSCSNNESDNGADLSGQNETPVLIGLLPVPGDSQVSLSWPEAEGNVAYYNIYWGESPDDLPNKESIASGQNTITIAGLSNGTNYYFEMDWEDADGNLSKRSAAISAQPFAPDLQAPEITSTTPADNAENVDIEPLISVTFSEPMDTSSINIEINPSKELRPMQFSMTGDELVLAAETPLNEGETYTIQVTGSDKAGNQLTGTTSFSFTTGYEQLAPNLLGNSPEDLSGNVPTNTRITITFSEPMNPISILRALTISPDIALSYGYDESGQTFTWSPQTDLAADTVYVVTLGTGALSARGNALAEEYSFSFTTSLTGPDETAPSVTGFLPEDDSSGVDPHFELAIAFSEPMDQAWAQAALTFPSDTGMTGTFTWNSQGTVMRFVPDEDPGYGEVITWKLLSGARDLAGNSMSGDVSGTFRIVRLVTVTIAGQPGLDGGISILDEVHPEWGDHWIEDSDSSFKIGAIFYTYLGPAISRGFLSFSLQYLPEELTEIHSASISFYQGGKEGDCLDIGGFYLESTHIGLSLTLDDYDHPTLSAQVCEEGGGCSDQLLSLEAICQEPGLFSYYPAHWTGDVTLAVQNDWDNRVAQMHHSQYRLRQKVESTDARRSLWFYSADYWGDYDYRPRLTVSYKIP